jgi:hypothetical protein
LAAFAAVTTERGWDLDVVRESETFPRAVVRRGADAVLVDLAIDATPQRPPTATLVGPTLDPDELTARKVVVLLDRAEARDFAEVYPLAERYGTRRLRELAPAIDAGFDRRPGDHARFAGPVQRRGNPCLCRYRCQHGAGILPYMERSCASRRPGNDQRIWVGCRGSPSGTTPRLPVKAAVPAWRGSMLRTAGGWGCGRGGRDGEPREARYLRASVGV